MYRWIVPRRLRWIVLYAIVVEHAPIFAGGSKVLPFKDGNRCALMVTITSSPIWHRITLADEVIGWYRIREQKVGDMIAVEYEYSLDDPSGEC